MRSNDDVKLAKPLIDILFGQKKTLLWVEDARALNEQHLEDAKKEGFKVVHKRNLELWENFPEHLNDFASVVFKVTNHNYDRVIRSVLCINDHKQVSPYRRPFVAVIPPPGIPGARTHFESLGCAVLKDFATEHIFPEVRRLLVEQAEQDMNGRVLITWPSISGHPVVWKNGINGEIEIENLLERKILRHLAEHHGEIMYPDDIAEAVGCERSEVKVYISRIRMRFTRSKPKGLRMGGDQFIATIDGGYRLNAFFRQ